MRRGGDGACLPLLPPLRPTAAPSALLAAYRDVALIVVVTRIADPPQFEGHIHSIPQHDGFQLDGPDVAQVLRKLAETAEADPPTGEPS